MGKKKPEPKPPAKKHKNPREAFHYPVEMKRALEDFRESRDPPPAKTAVIVAALREYLDKRGFPSVDSSAGKPPSGK